jgi:hypothetical protein
MKVKIFAIAILTLIALTGAGAAPPTPPATIRPAAPLTPITRDPLREIWDAPLVTDANGHERQEGLVSFIVSQDFNSGVLANMNARVELIRDRAAPAPLRKMEEQ